MRWKVFWPALGKKMASNARAAAILKEAERIWSVGITVASWSPVMNGEL
jgi:hypothetical protein